MDVGIEVQLSLASERLADKYERAPSARRRVASTIINGSPVVSTIALGRSPWRPSDEPSPRSVRTWREIRPLPRHLYPIARCTSRAVTAARATYRSATAAAESESTVPGIRMDGPPHHAIAPSGAAMSAVTSPEVDGSQSRST
jgi:hypothetical protein